MNFGIKQDQEGLYVIIRVVVIRGPVTFLGAIVRDSLTKTLSSLQYAVFI